MALLIFLTCATLFYVTVHCALRIGLSKIQSYSNDSTPFVSVIVAARNEEKHLPTLLHALFAQTYQHYEIIVVNDRSTDRTAEILANEKNKYPRLSIVTITDIQTDLPPKKNALQAGIQHARGEILCFTDADCIPPPNWISKLVAAFDPSVGFVVGYSPYTSVGQATLLSSFVAYEEFRAAIWAAGSIGLRRAWLCTGRNIAYRKIVFDEVGGYESTKMSISGDDDLFLLTVRRRTKWDIRYVSSPESHVLTYPPQSLKAFIEQRKRHFSAARYFTFPMKVFFTAYHCSNIIILAMFLYGIFITQLLPWSLGALILKFGADFFILEKGARLLDERKHLQWFVPMELLYILYNSVVGPLGLFFKFSWKQQ